MRALIAFLLFTWTTNVTLASTITIITDELSAEKAREVQALLKRTPPFSRMKTLKVNVSAKKINCSTVSGPQPTDTTTTSVQEEYLPESCRTKGAGDDPTLSLQRLIQVDCGSALATVQAETNSDYLIFVKDDKSYGGSGGSFPTMTTGSPATVGVHELLHQMGMADEYEYSTACEADLFCVAATTREKSSKPGYLPSDSYNVTTFEDHPPYQNDARARAMHSSQIPWYSAIQSRTKITTGSNLGTPPGDNVIGLFRGQTCNKSSGRLKSWVSGNKMTLMESISTNYIPEHYWPTIAAALGETLEQQTPKNEEVCENFDFSEGSQCQSHDPKAGSSEK